MRILVVGAGATGGYYGGRLLEAGRDVTFLVRPERAKRLSNEGLTIRSPFGDFHTASPPTVSADAVRGPYDLVLLSCKAYDLDDATGSFAPAVGERTGILPLLNGMRHFDALDARFGPERVLGGWCFIVARLESTGEIVHSSDVHGLAFGERSGERSERVAAIDETMRTARFDSRASDAISLELWEKWVFLATLAGSTCLMRAAVGDIVAAGGKATIEALLDECRVIATEAGFAPRPEVVEGFRRRLTAEGSRMTASMLADVENGRRTEGEHILGDLLRRRVAIEPAQPSLLQLAQVALRSHEVRIARGSQ